MKKEQSEIFADERRAAAFNEVAKELPLNRREKMMIVVMAIIALIPVIHLAVVYLGLSADAVIRTSAISAYSGKWILPILAVCNIVVVPAAVGKNFYTQATKLSKNDLKRPAESVIRAYRFWLNLIGIVFVALIGYALEVFLRQAQGVASSISGWILAGFVVIAVASTAVYYHWLRQMPDDESNRNHFGRR